MEKGRDKRIVSVLMTLTIIFTLMGGTLSYLRWQTSEAQKTNVVFTVNQDFSCAADGGGNIQSATLMPASCTNPKYAIQRTVTVTPTINRDDLSINMDLWLDINTLGSGLSRSEYFKYALTTVENDCTKGIISEGTFTGLSSENDDKVMLLNQQEYSTSEPQTYYLYIWIDPLEENNYILEQPFNFSLGGSCTDNPEVKPSEPELDPGMIPVTISDTGVVTTISENDNNWYDYENKEWANVVLVNENATSGVTGSKSREYYLNNPGITVVEDDILAYYVWIPRYSYRIPMSAVSIKCSDINGVNINDYPECYSMILNNEEDKTSLIQGVYALALQQGVSSYTMSNATTEVEAGLESGMFNSDKMNIFNMSMFELGITYNSMVETPVDYSAELQQNRNIQKRTVKCSDIVGVNIDDYPGCYSVILNSEGEKENLIQGVYYLALQQGYTTYTMEDAIREVEEGLEMGVFFSVKLGMLGKSMFEMMEMYNSMVETPVDYSAKLQTNRMKPVGNEETIDIYFESKDASIKTGDAVNTYRTHPSFIWDGKTIGGIWVGKFETTGNATTPTVKPKKYSLTNQNVSAQFTTSLKFAGGTQTGSLVNFTGSNTYGLTNQTDSHMMKNSDWGAVAYLSHSKYGIDGEIRINNYFTIVTLTGCGALTADEAKSTSCGISYGTPSSGRNTYPQSTTGNITGIFDMSGGAIEYVMGVLSDEDGNPRSGNGDSNNSGFNGMLYNNGIDKLYESGISFPESKYYDLYFQSQFNGGIVSNMMLCTIETCGGHALKETAQWYNDIANFVNQEHPWFVRGSGHLDGAHAGAFGSYNGSGGAPYDNLSWRSVLIVGDGA